MTLCTMHSGTEYNALMGMTTVNAWECDQCGYLWLKVAGRTPLQCPSRKCRSRAWNAKISLPAAVKPPIPDTQPNYYLPKKYRK